MEASKFLWRAFTEGSRRSKVQRENIVSLTSLVGLDISNEQDIALEFPVDRVAELKLGLVPEVRDDGSGDDTSDSGGTSHNEWKGG